MRPRQIRNVPPKTLEELVKEWDSLAAERAAQIHQGVDISLNEVVVPAVRRLAGPPPRTVLDVGCGTGTVTPLFKTQTNTVVGVDPSRKSVAIAKRGPDAHGVNFVAASVEEFAASTTQQFDLVVSNMTLMDVPNLDSALEATAALLAKRGRLVFSITHPWFWPFYWEYNELEWFDYNSEIFIEAEFTITRARTNRVTTHVHRPLERYLATFARHGLCLSALSEPMPPSHVAELYPTPWRFPRFLAGALVRT